MACRNWLTRAGRVCMILCLTECRSCSRNVRRITRVKSKRKEQMTTSLIGEHPLLYVQDHAVNALLFSSSRYLS